jgi:hypothetical protein
LTDFTAVTPHANATDLLMSAWVVTNPLSGTPPLVVLPSVPGILHGGLIKGRPMTLVVRAVSRKLSCPFLFWRNCAGRRAPTGTQHRGNALYLAHQPQNDEDQQHQS